MQTAAKLEASTLRSPSDHATKVGGRGYGVHCRLLDCHKGDSELGRRVYGGLPQVAFADYFAASPIRTRSRTKPRHPGRFLFSVRVSMTALEPTRRVSAAGVPDEAACRGAGAADALSGHYHRAGSQRHSMNQLTALLGRYRRATRTRAMRSSRPLILRLHRLAHAGCATEDAHRAGHDFVWCHESYLRFVMRGTKGRGSTGVLCVASQVMPQ